MKTISISLSQDRYQYSVRIGKRVLETCLNQLVLNIADPTLYLITNETVNALYPEIVQPALPRHLALKTLVLPDGELHKNFDSIQDILDFLTTHGANRKSTLISLGGGVIGDITGFAAAIFMRGIPFIQIPTTLLSQVDSGIGGKTGINLPAGKNLVGAFKQPLETIIDVDFLETLPPRQFIAGYAELVKHAFIQDKELFELLAGVSPHQLKRETDLLIDVIHRSCSVKAKVVEQDEKESGIRAILNFGHTLGHFFETFTNYTHLLHGEAVILGMMFSAWWSFKHSCLSQEDYTKMINHLDTLGVKWQIGTVSKERFLEIVNMDKKNSARGIRFIGLTSIGQAKIFDETPPEALWNDYLEFLRAGPIANNTP